MRVSPPEHALRVSAARYNVNRRPKGHKYELRRGDTLAKKSKSSQTDEAPDVVDADKVVLDATPEDDPKASEADTNETPPEPQVAPEVEPEPEVEEPVDVVEEQPAPPVQSAPEPHDSASNSVFLPAILGGLIAAGLGFGAAYYFIPRFEPSMVETMNTNEAAIAALQEDVAGIDINAAVVPLTEEVGAISTQITDQFAALEGRIVSFEERLLVLEKQPSGDGTLQEAALEAYQAELDNLRSQVEEQAGAAFAQLESTRAEAAAIEEAALLAARNAKGRAALAQIRSALDTGAPMAAAITELEDVMGAPAPDGLAAVAEGVPTLAKLQGDFPPAARQALANARSEGASGESTGAFGSFLREQLNVRSVAPREGDDADAILSRAEAALKEGQLETALAEVANLPEIAAGPLAGWVNQAQARADALVAANEISTSLNDN
jgi:hypothetical protein